MSTSGFNTTFLNYDLIENLSVNNLWKQILKKQEVLVEDYKIDALTNLPVICMGAPVFIKSGKLIGVVAIEINIDAINAIMFENNPHNGLGNSGESYLVENDFHMEVPPDFRITLYLKQKLIPMVYKKH